MNPVQALRTDLHGSGVFDDACEQACTAYARALADRSSEHWEIFYRTLYNVLRSAEAPASVPAATSLLSILEDDLGTQLFTAAQLHALRAELGISDACAEQSLRHVSVLR
jgi:hypothetical protein